MDYEPIDRDVENLQGILEEAKLTKGKNGRALEQQDAARTDHP
jgi:hypothetical protein